MAIFHAECEAFRSAVSDDRQAESDALALAIDTIVLSTCEEVEVAPGVWETEFDTDTVNSPIRESEIIRLIGEPDFRYDDSLWYRVASTREVLG